MICRWFYTGRLTKFLRETRERMPCSITMLLLSLHSHTGFRSGNYTRPWIHYQLTIVHNVTIRQYILDTHIQVHICWLHASVWSDALAQKAYTIKIRHNPPSIVDPSDKSWSAAEKHCSFSMSQKSRWDLLQRSSWSKWFYLYSKYHMSGAIPGSFSSPTWAVWC